MSKRKRQRARLLILIKIKRIEKLDEFIEKRIIPMREKYPYAEICIEVEN